MPLALPTPDDVALLMRTRTVGPNALTGGLGGDTGPAETTTWDATTRPTVTEVQRIIQTAYDSLIGSVVGGPDAVPVDAQGAFRHAVKLYSITLIEWSFFRDQIDDAALRERRDEITSNLAAVNAAVELTKEKLAPAFGAIVLTTGRSPVLPTPADPIPGIDY